DQAIQHWNKALKFNNNNADVHKNIGTAYFSLNQPILAVNHWRQALSLEPNQSEVLNNLSWTFATTDNSQLHNPTEAVSLAEKAANLTNNQNAGILDTLSVAYASAGKFPQAINAANNALELAITANDNSLADTINQHLALFNAGKTIRNNK
ncbi:MAG: tetratricopeptide repeat protein, partial [Planctomycetes bacterium]|nr:tetratricopeptide repeat protein [Planctomycetota bacterium]